MRLKWTSITESEFEHFIARCNFTPVELRILRLRRKGCTPTKVAEKIGYSEAQMYRLSADIIAKIKKEMRV